MCFARLGNRTGYGETRKLRPSVFLELRLRVARAVMYPANRLLLCMPGGLGLGPIDDLVRVIGQLRFFFVRRCADNHDDGLIAAGHGLCAKLEAEAAVFKGVPV